MRAVEQDGLTGVSLDKLQPSGPLHGFQTDANGFLAHRDFVAERLDRCHGQGRIELLVFAQQR